MKLRRRRIERVETSLEPTSKYGRREPLLSGRALMTLTAAGLITVVDVISPSVGIVIISFLGLAGLIHQLTR
jgi:hypothetical protein